MQIKLPKKLNAKQMEIIQQHMSAITTAMASAQPKNLVGKIDASTTSEKTILLSIGKQAIDFARAFVQHTREDIPHVFVAQISGYETTQTLPGWNLCWQNHPIPNEQTIAQSARIIAMIDALIRAKPELNLHVLVSGGASAAFAVPEPGIPNEVYTSIITQAFVEGKSINELNQIRSFFDCVKGGKLAARYPATDIYTWIISDVVSDDPRIVGSGPTVPGLQITQNVKEWIIHQFQLTKVDIPIEHLFELVYIANSTEREGILQNTIIGTRNTLLEQIMLNLTAADINYKLVNTDIIDSVDSVAKNMIAELNATNEKNLTLLFTGEPVVQLSKNALCNGSGGRISALAIILADEIEHVPNCIFCGIATDGKDGSSPDPAYVITSDTAKHIRPLGGPKKLLNDGKSGQVLSSLGFGLHFPTTGINYMDIYLLISY